MCEIVVWDHYKTANVLITILRDGAEAHAERMITRMARHRDRPGEDRWRAVEAALNDLRRKGRGRRRVGLYGSGLS